MGNTDSSSKKNPNHLQSLQPYPYQPQPFRSQSRQPQPKVEKTVSGAILHRINSRRPLIYSTSLQPITDYTILQTKRKYYRKLGIVYPNLLSQLKSQRKLNKLIEITKNPRSIIIHELLKMDSNRSYPHSSAICSFFRSIRRVKSLSIDLNCYYEMPRSPASQKSQKQMLSILPHVRCKPVFFSFNINISIHYEDDHQIPTLVKHLVKCIKPMRQLKSLHMNLAFVNPFLQNRSTHKINLPESIEELKLIEKLGAKYRRLKSIKDFSLRFDFDIHSVFRCFLQKFEALPSLQSIDLDGLDLLVFEDFVKANQRDKCLTFATYGPSSKSASKNPIVKDKEITNRWILRNSHNFDRVLEMIRPSEITLTQSSSPNRGIHFGIFTRKFLSAATKEFQNKDYLRVCLFERKDIDFSGHFAVETLSTNIHAKELTFCINVGPEDYLHLLTQLLNLPSGIQKVALILKLSSTPISDADSLRLVTLLSKIARFPLLRDMTIFIDGMTPKSIYFAQEVISKLLQVDSLTLGYTISADCNQQSYEQALNGLVNTFKLVERIKRVTIAISVDGKFKSSDVKYYAAIEKSMSNGKTDQFLLRRVENITRLFYTGRQDLI